MICFGIALHCSVRALHRPEPLRHSISMWSTASALDSNVLAKDGTAKAQYARKSNGSGTDRVVRASDGIVLAKHCIGKAWV